MSASNETANNSFEPRELRPGMLILDTYEVRGLLGRGGMGAVYRVYHRYLRKEMAMKTLRGDQVTNHTWLRFEAEAKSIAKLEHPNIIPIYDMGVCESGQPFYTMELLNGQGLDAWTASHPVTAAQAILIFRQVACALAYAHERGIIHRDIKPANIVLTFAEANKPPVVKVVDFGIAKLMRGTQGLTREGEVFGSPFYLSPEQASGLRVDPRSDIYSFGCAIYEILTGFPPFKGKSAVETMFMHLDRSAVPIERARPEVSYPPGLSLVVQKCMAKEPGARYDNAAQLAQDLFKIEQGQGEEVAVRLARTSYLQASGAGSELKRQVLSGRPSAARDASFPARSYGDSPETDLFLRDCDDDDDDAQEESGGEEATSSGNKHFLVMGGLLAFLFIAVILGGSYWQGAFSNLLKSPEEREQCSCEKLYPEINHFRLTAADLQKLALREPPQEDRLYYLFPVRGQDLVGRIVLEPKNSDTHNSQYIEATGLVSVPRRRKGLALILSHKLALNPRLLERFGRDDVTWIEFPANETAGPMVNANLKNDTARTNVLLAKLYQCCPSIARINTANACLDEESLVIVSKFKELRRLNIPHAKWNSKEPLAKLTSASQFIDLTLPPCQDISMVLRQLAAGGIIQDLQLNRFEGSATELNLLRKLKSLKTFICRQSRVSPQLMEILSTFPQLNVLNLSSCYVPERVRPVLLGMKGLNSLTLPRDIAQMWKTNVLKDFAGRKLFILQFQGLGMEWATEEVVRSQAGSVDFEIP